MSEQMTESVHVPVHVYEMPEESQEALLRRIDDGTAVPELTVCAACAPEHVMDQIEDGTLDLSDGDALAAQWPCDAALAAAEPDVGERDA